MVSYTSIIYTYIFVHASYIYLSKKGSYYVALACFIISEIMLKKHKFSMLLDCCTKGHIRRKCDDWPLVPGNGKMALISVLVFMDV